MNLWTKKCKLVRVWTCGLSGLCRPVDVWTLWTCELCGPVDSVDL